MFEEKATLAAWSQRYQQGHTGWDIGRAAPALAQYFRQLTDKSLRILVPGAGKGWEVALLHELGFSHAVYLDTAPEAASIFHSNCPDFNPAHIVVGDFFGHQASYDLIVEQTFFCAIPPSMRSDYVQKAHALLRPGGKIVGLLFNHYFEQEGPPYGGSPEEYRQLFGDTFSIKTFEMAHNSIKPRQNREHFVIFQKKQTPI